jgi:hypothetical protein
MREAQRIAARRPKSEEWKRARAEAMREHWQHPEEHGRPLRHTWTDEEVALLGTASDRAVAKRLGIGVHLVETQRKRLGIPAYGRPK